MSVGNIYLIINKENGHKYVGQTIKTINQRWAQHIQEARRMSGYPLHRAIRKYGAHKFMVKELWQGDVDLLDEKEKYYMDVYETFTNPKHYNAKDGGDRPILSEETKQKLSKISSKHIRTKEHIANMSAAMKKIPHNYGFHLPENRGTGATSRCKMKSVNVETGEERIWESATAAAEELTGNRRKHTVILGAADNGWKAYGYRWQRLGPKTNKKPVYGVHKITWERTPVYPSGREAIRQHSGSNAAKSGILKSLKNPNKYSWLGYYWFYAS